MSSRSRWKNAIRGTLTPSSRVEPRRELHLSADNAVFDLPAYTASYVIPDPKKPGNSGGGLSLADRQASLSLELNFDNLGR